MYLALNSTAVINMLKYDFVLTLRESILLFLLSRQVHNKNRSNTSMTSHILYEKAGHDPNTISTQNLAARSTYPRNHSYLNSAKPTLGN